MAKKILFGLVLFVLALCSVGCNAEQNDSSESSDSMAQTEMTTATGQVYVTVTDSEGNTVTDSDGAAVTTVQPVIITQVPQTTYVTVTDDNGAAVTDNSGNAVTSAQTIWVTTMQAVGNDNQVQSTTTYSGNDESESDDPATTTVAKSTTTTKATVNTTNASTTTKTDGGQNAETTTSSLTTSSAAQTTTTAVTTTTTADTSDEGNNTEIDYAYGAASALSFDINEVSEDGELMYLIFDVSDDANGVYNVEFHELLLVNINLEEFEYTKANGCVSVGQGIQTDVPTGGEPTAYIGCVEGNAGEQIAVPVMIKNNQGICSFDFKVKYDSSALSLVSIEKAPMIQSDSWMFIVNTDFTP